MQVYRDIPIVSAAPTAAEMAKHPHSLYGEWDGAQPCSAPDWAMRARSRIEQACEVGAVPILVGGTGMYLTVLLDGIAPVPEIDAEIRAEVRALPVEAAYAALKEADPEGAARLRPRDGQRIARALEVIRSTGRPLHSHHAKHEGGIGDRINLNPVRFLPDRALLVSRSEGRFRSMIERGALDEVERLLSRKLDPSLPVMRAIGVPELAAHLRETVSLDQAVERAQIATRRYAKRQSTWFRRQPPGWWPIAHTADEALSAFARLLQPLGTKE